MHARPPLRPLAAALLLAALVTPARGAIKIIAFGDSITEGWFDGLNPTGSSECIEDLGKPPDQCGYPGRLSSRLNSQNYDVLVRNYGKGGEKTVQGLSRLQTQVLPANQDLKYFVLLEGTNDITKWPQYSLETIESNLRSMGNLAANRGAQVVISTLIPRWPNAPVDPSNIHVEALNARIRSLAANRGWPLVEAYNHFRGLTNLFPNYYQQWMAADPVGHPNRSGHDQLANVITPVVKALQPPRVSLANPSPVATGATVTFSASLPDPVSWLEWDFGDGGRAWGASAAQAGTVQYRFLAAGTYTVKLTATGAGGSRTVTITVSVTGTAPNYARRLSLVPLFERGDGSLATDLTTQLSLANSGAQGALAILRLLPEVRDDATFGSGQAPETRVYVANGSTLVFADAVDTLFAIDRRRGALEVDYYLPAGASTAGLSASAQLRIAEPPGVSDTVLDLPSGGWSAAEKQLANLDLDNGETVFVSVTNLDATACRVYAEVRDNNGVHRDSAVFDLEPRATRIRSLGDIAFGLLSRPGPYDVRLLASTCRFTAHAVEIRPGAGTVLDYASTP